MHAARHCVFRSMDRKEFLHFAQYALKRPCFIAGRGLDRIAMHRIAGPNHVCALLLDGLDQPRQVIADSAGTEPCYERQTPRFILRVKFFHQNLKIFSGRGRSTFQANRVLHPAAELHMGTVGLARPIANPHHMPRSRHIGPACAVQAAQSLFIFQQQRLMRCIKINGA